MKYLINLEDVHKSYETDGAAVHAVCGVSLAIERGEFVAIMGPSGSGKSTLMHIIGCLDRPTRGRYFLNETDISLLDPDELADIRNAKIGFVFQSFNLLMRTTALENVLLPMLCSGRRRPNRAMNSRAMQCLAHVGVEKWAGHFPNQLSGGQQQRVAIARALVNEPEVVIADEPTGNLDSRTSMEIMNIFMTLNAGGVTVIMVTHNPDIVGWCNRQLLMRDGILENQTCDRRPVVAAYPFA